MVKRKSKFSPLVVYDATGMVREYWLAAHVGGDDAVLLVRSTARDYIYVREMLIGQIGPAGSGCRFVSADKEPEDLVPRYKEYAMSHGATPEAIRLLGQFCPLTHEEEEVMAEKLKPKGAKSADKEGLKAAAKAAPVGGKKAAEAPKKKGNHEALAKAREAAAERKSALAAEKITILVKAKDSGLRGGRLAKLEFVEKAKPKKVGDVLGQTFTHEGKEIVIDAGALRGMEKREHISIG